MTEGQLRDVMRSFDGALDDVRREQGWRRIERTLGAPVPAAPARRWRFVAVPAVAVAVAVAAVMLHVRAGGDQARPPLARTELVAAAGQQTISERGGVVLTLVGPGVAVVTEGDPRGLHVRVESGALVADRASTAPTIVLEAAGSTTTSRDARIAVRVQPGLVVFGAGEEARAILERHQLALPPRAPEPVVPPPDSVRPEPPVPPPAVPEVEPPPVAPPAEAVQPEPPAVPEVEPPPGVPEVEPPPVAPRLAATELYARAEAALRAKDPSSARQLLQRILAEHPEHPLVDAARYDLALIALGAGDPELALGYARQIIDAGRDANLRAAARKLHERIQRETR